MASRLHITLGIVFACLCNGTAVIAGLAGDSEISWRTESRNGRFVFVRVSALPLDKELSRIEETSVDGEELARQRHELSTIRSRYSESGMYRNDGSRDPLWTTTENLGFVHIADDGIHLAQPFHQRSWPSGRVVRFIAGGKTVKEITTFDLFSVWMFRRFLLGDFPSCTEVEFDPAMLTYSIATNMDDKIVIDVKTGSIVSSNVIRNTVTLLASRPRVWGMSLAAIVFPVVFWRLCPFGKRASRCRAAAKRT